MHRQGELPRCGIDRDAGTINKEDMLCPRMGDGVE